MTMPKEIDKAGFLKIAPTLELLMFCSVGTVDFADMQRGDIHSVLYARKGDDSGAIVAQLIQIVGFPGEGIFFQTDAPVFHSNL
jgi:hypothetical protein